jgi:hypothetical protein
MCILHVVSAWAGAYLLLVPLLLHVAGLGLPSRPLFLLDPVFLLRGGGGRIASHEKQVVEDSTALSL